MKQFNGYKFCPHCECIFPIIMFYRDNYKSDNLTLHCIDCTKESQQTPKSKEIRAKASKKYNQSPKGKMTRRRYCQSKRGKRSHVKYRQSPKGRLTNARGYSKYRDKGFILLVNNPFPEEIPIEYHHISPNLPFVIPLPRVTHRYVLGDNHFIHNLKWIRLLYSLENL